MRSNLLRNLFGPFVQLAANRFTVTSAVLTLLGIASALTGCGLISEDTREGVAIPPTSVEPTVDLGLGPGCAL